MKHGVLVNKKHEIWSEKCCAACRGPHQHPVFILVLKFYHTLFWYHKCWFWFVSNWAARILCLRLSSRFRHSGLTLHIYSLHSLHRTMTMTPRHHETQKHENIGYRYRYQFPSLNPKQVKWDNTTLCTTHPAQYMHKYITCTNMPVNIYTHRTRTLGVIHAQIHNMCRDASQHTYVYIHVHIHKGKKHRATNATNQFLVVASCNAWNSQCLQQLAERSFAPSSGWNSQKK